MAAMKLRGCAVVIALIAGLTATGCPSETAVEAEEPAAVSTSVAAGAARDLIKEIYTSLRRGSTGGLLPLLDPGLLAIGPAPGDLYTDRSAALVALAAAVTDGEKHKLSSKNLRVVASPAGHAAWATDLIELDGRRYAIGVILVEADELWTVAAVQVAVPIGKKELASLLDKGPLPEPTVLPPPAIGADKALAEEWKLAASDPATLSEQVADSPEAVARDLAGKASVGRKAIRKAWKKAHKKVATAPRADGVHARVAPDGTMGWVFGTVDVTDGKDPPVPTRTLYVYDKASGGWALMLAFPSIAQAR
jgi:ketosteroid isomerase-like protein